MADKVVPRQVARLGRTVRLQCPVEGDPPPLTMWTKDGRTIHGGWSRFRVLPQGLKVKEVEPEDAGAYVCKATNGFGSLSVNYTLIVMGQCQVFRRRPGGSTSRVPTATPVLPELDHCPQDPGVPLAASSPGHPQPGPASSGCTSGRGLSSRPLLPQSSAGLRGQGWLGDSRSGWGAPARTKVQPGGPGRPVALASAVTLRLRFPSSEGPLGSKGLVFSASGARAWGLGGAPATRPSLAGTRRWPGPPPRAPEQHKGGARPTHPTAGFPGWGPRAGPWSWALEAAAVPGRGHSSAFPAPPRSPLDCGMGILWVSPTTSFQRGG